jgi:hypothetical protein
MRLDIFTLLQEECHVKPYSTSVRSYQSYSEIVLSRILPKRLPVHQKGHGPHSGKAIADRQARVPKSHLKIGYGHPLYRNKPVLSLVFRYPISNVIPNPNMIRAISESKTRHAMGLLNIGPRRRAP